MLRAIVITDFSLRLSLGVARIVRSAVDSSMVWDPTANTEKAIQKLEIIPVWSMRIPRLHSCKHLRIKILQNYSAGTGLHVLC